MELDLSPAYLCFFKESGIKSRLKSKNVINFASGYDLEFNDFVKSIDSEIINVESNEGIIKNWSDKAEYVRRIDEVCFDNSKEIVLVLKMLHHAPELLFEGVNQAEKSSLSISEYLMFSFERFISRSFNNTSSKIDKDDFEISSRIQNFYNELKISVKGFSRKELLFKNHVCGLNYLRELSF